VDRSAYEVPLVLHIVVPSLKSAEEFPGSSRAVLYFDGAFGLPIIPVPETP